MVLRIFISLIFLFASISVPLYFDTILFFIVKNIGLGWVVTTILIRLIVIIFFTPVLVQLFSFSPRLKRIKTWVVFLIALVPGFGISFISPIYTTDYGMLNDEMKLTDENFLTTVLHVNDLPENGHIICAFFTTTCPHCMAASEKLGANIEGGQKVPVWAFFPGNQADTDQFITKYNGSQFNTQMIDNDSIFVTAAGNSFPSIFLINHKGETEYHWTGDEMNYSALDYLKSLEQ